MDTGEVTSNQKFRTVDPIETLEGDDGSTSVSPQLITRLRDAGYRSLQSIIVLGAQQISHDIHIESESSQRICGLASMKLRDFARKIEGSHDDYSSQSPPMNHIKTGSAVLDNYLGGGIEMGAMTEFFGRSGSGKTQLCHTLSVVSQIPQLNCRPRSDIENKLNKVIYIDTEGTFRSQRVEQIVRAKGLSGEKTINNITLIECYSIFEQEQCLKQVCGLLDKDGSISLIIIDSIIVHFRSEYHGRSKLPERQQRLNKYLSTLSKIARIYKVAVVQTNQVQSTPSDNSYSNHTDGSTGGNILSHASTHRIRLNRPFENVSAKIIKSPYQHSSLIDARFTITDKGIDDLEDELNMLFHRNQQTRSTISTFN